MGIVSALASLKLLQVGVFAAVLAAAGGGIAASDSIAGALGIRDTPEKLEHSVHRTKEQSSDAHEATVAVGQTLAQMSGAGIREAAAPAPAPTPMPAAGAPMPAAGPGVYGTAVAPSFSDQAPGSVGYDVDRRSYELTQGRSITLTQQKVKALRAQWDHRYSAVRDANEVLLRDIRKTREYKDAYFDAQRQRIEGLQVGARNAGAIRDAMRNTLTRQDAAFAKWEAAATEVEANVTAMMNELDNLDQLMQFLDDGATFDQVLNDHPQIAERTLLLHGDILRLEEASLELAGTLGR